MPRLARHVFEKLERPDLVLGAGNGTWIDRIERIGFGAATTMYGHIAECYSAMPLANLAATLLRPAAAATNVAVVACDYAGEVSGVRIERERV
jgi:hypothetical protein